MNKTADLAYWITERYSMKLRRDAGAKPDLPGGWSNDKNMGWVRYCNVHREDDAVTKWLAQNWRPKHHQVWEIVLARMINYTPSLNQILVGWGQHPDEDPIARAFTDLKIERAQGKKIFTSAYTISTCGQAMDKLDYVMGVVNDTRSFESKWQPKFEGCTSTWDRRTLAEAHFILTHINGLGSFLAAQVIADLKNTEGHPLQDAPDWHTWAAPGPGSLKGLSEYFGASISAGKFDYHIKKCYDEVMPLIPSYVPPIHMQDFQNCLCEFSKYERVKRGGHVRNKYRPWEN